MNILIGGSLESCTGAEELQIATALADTLKAQGHTTDMFMLPYEPDAQGLPEQITALHMLTLESTDLLITVGYPALFLPHARKSCYLLKTAPMLFEYWDTEYGALYNPSFYRIKEAVTKAERRCLQESKTIVCGSNLLRQDLEGRYSIQPHVCYYPAFADEIEDENFFNEFPPKTYFVTESDLFPATRMELLIDVVKTSKANWKLKWYVPRTQITYLEALHELIQQNNLSSRIQIIPTRCPYATMQSALAYVTLLYETRKIPESFMRAFDCGVPIIAPQDAGAVLELADSKNNNIVQPNNFALAHVLDTLFTKKKVTKIADPSRDIKTSSIQELAKRLVG